MVSRIFRLRSQATQAFDAGTTLVKTKLNTLETAANKIEIPERFKGTVVEKWAGYWKNLYRDYYDVADGVVKQTNQRATHSGSILRIHSRHDVLLRQAQSIRQRFFRTIPQAQHGPDPSG